MSVTTFSSQSWGSWGRQKTQFRIGDGSVYQTFLIHGIDFQKDEGSDNKPPDHILDDAVLSGLLKYPHSPPSFDELLVCSFSVIAILKQNIKFVNVKIRMVKNNYMYPVRWD